MAKRIEENLINIEQCADLLNMTVNQLYKLTSKKQIPFYKFGKVIRFYRPEVEEWILKNRVAA